MQERVIIYSALAGILAALYLTSLYNYLLFHSVTELFSILISFGIFVIAWNSRRWIRNNYLVFIGIASLFVGFLDLLHAISYKGMGVFHGNTSNLATQLWIAARYLQSISLLAAPFFLGRKLDERLMASIYIGGTAILLLSIFYWQNFPVMYVEGSGLTLFKISSEYVISAFFILSALLLWKKRKEFDPSVLKLLLGFILATIAAELAFTQYIGVYDLSNMVGHLLRVLAFYFLYRALVETGIVRPFNLLFLDLKRSEEALRGERNQLEIHVRERTMELAHSNEKLIREIEERKLAEEHLKESNLLLKEAMEELKAAQSKMVEQERLRALGTLASGIAHDFNNVLTPILGFTDLLLAKPSILDDRKKTFHYLQLVHTAATDAAMVVRRLREFYRQRDDTDIFLPVDLKEIIPQAISLSQPRWKDQAQERGVTIGMKTDLQRVPLVFGNESALREVLINLIFNAADAMERDGTITIKTWSDASKAVIEVVDTGVGMSEEVRRRCFEPFFTTKKERGTGLGLSMAYGIIHRHGGSIAVQSEEGKGTAFILRLPEMSEEEKKKLSAPVSLISIRSLHILVVDDEPAVRELVSQYLIEDGHRVEEAADGPKGLEKVNAGRFDLVITDMAMPGMNGVQLAEAIKKIDPDQRIILLTGFGSIQEEKPSAISLVVEKPVTFESLRQAVARVIAGA